MLSNEVLIQYPDIYKKRFKDRDPDFVLVGGESLRDRLERVRGFLAHIAIQAHEGDTESVLVVTHGGVIDDMFRLLSNHPMEQETGLQKPYGCISSLLFDGTTWQAQDWVNW